MTRPVTWQDLPATTTPINAANLNTMQDGIIGLNGRRINVRDPAYGAVGDGSTNDTTAVQLAAAAIVGGHNDVLYFPAGSYRITTGGTAISIAGKSRFGILMDPGAELLMDNVTGGNGTGHGFFVGGSASDIHFKNVRVRWATQPTNRSFGDGFNFLGYPSDSAVDPAWSGSTGKLQNIIFENCTTINAAQTGAIFMGCSDVRVTSFRPETTKADGLHYNACRRTTTAGLNAYNTGDDSLAYVTYMQPATTTSGSHTLPQSTVTVGSTIGFPTSGQFRMGTTQIVTYTAKTSNTFTGCSGGTGTFSGGTAVTMLPWLGSAGPFTQPSLGDWSNYSSTATAIQSYGSSADGIRVAGSYNVSINGFSVHGGSAGGVVIDSGDPGGGFSWGYEGSKSIVVSGGAINSCGIGIFGRAFNVSTSAPANYWTHDVQFDNIEIRNCSNWLVRTDTAATSGGRLAGVNFNNIRMYYTSGNGIGFSSLRDCSITNIYANGCGIGFYGQDTGAAGVASLTTRNNIYVDSIMCEGGSILFLDLYDAVVGTVVSRNSVQDGVIFQRCRDFEVKSARVVLANRNNSALARALAFLQVQDVNVMRATVVHDANNVSWRALEIGGGVDSSNIAANNLRLHDIEYRNTINGSGNDVVLQGGSFGPINYMYNIRNFNGGEGSPVWRQIRTGQQAWVDPVPYITGASPESAITAPVGQLALNTAGSTTTTFYVKTSGTSNTGYTGK